MTQYDIQEASTGDMNWSGGLVEWTDDERAYVSVVFSWQKQQAYQRIAWYKKLGYEVWVGGPAAYYDQSFFEGVAFVAPPNKLIGDVVWRHNPSATFTTRGCIRECPFCIVPIAEPKYEELMDWEALPVICDNNILASSKDHFEDVVSKLKGLRGVDFNQGLDARLLTKWHAELLCGLDLKMVRLAWDWIGMEAIWLSAFQTLLDVGFRASDIQSYVLIGFNDDPEDALYRLQTVKKLGARPNPMRYQPLDSIKRNEYVHPNWTDRELKDYMRYWSRQNWLSKIPFEEYVNARSVT